MCGEKGAVGCHVHKGQGSPPRVRGKATPRTPVAIAPGITPACAGKRTQSSLNLSEGGDHPRVCGEKRFNRDQTILTTGSPPRVRGKGTKLTARKQTSRITPACAGKSRPRICVNRHYRDHPRVCGEKRCFPVQGSVQRGSPPRVRGKVIGFDCTLMRFGITPACAGKSNAKEFACKDGRDHPRVCGEKTKKIP